MLEYICNDNKFLIGCVYFWTNLNCDESLNLFQDTLMYIPKIYKHQHQFSFRQFKSSLRGKLPHILREGEQGRIT